MKLPLIKKVNSAPLSIEPDFKKIADYRDNFGTTSFVYFSEGSCEKNAEIYDSYKDQQGFDKYYINHFQWQDFSRNADINRILGDQNMKFLTEAVEYLKKISDPIDGSVNGIALYIKRESIETPEHSHLFDQIYNSGPQLVIWANKDKKMARFWFNIEGKKVFWPDDLSESNAYVVDAKIPHAGDAQDCLTLFIISMCRNLKPEILTFVD